MQTSIPAMTVMVNRSISPERVLRSMGRVLHVDSSVVATMPRGGGGIAAVTVVFFNLGFIANSESVAQEYDRRFLIPDPYALIAVNLANPGLVDTFSNGTQWQDNQGFWCFVNFTVTDGKRVVNAYRRMIDWYDDWYFGGVRKSDGLPGRSLENRRSRPPGW